LLDVSGAFLAFKNRYNSKGGWDLEAEIPWVHDSFEGIEEASSKDGIIRVEYVDDVEADVFSVWGFCGVPKETGKVMISTSSILFPSKL
jgi:hypothetical protein